MKIDLSLGFDSESDVAAMVYGDDDDPDAALRLFVRRRLERGIRVLGVLQERQPGTWGRRRNAGYRLLAPAVATLADIDVDGPDQRNDDPIGPIGAAIVQSLPAAPHLLVINRYGRLEARGEGLFAPLVRAATSGVPVVVPVPAAMFPRWLEMGGGLAVKLAPTVFALERWWRAIVPYDAVP